MEPCMFIVSLLLHFQFVELSLLPANSYVRKSIFSTQIFNLKFKCLPIYRYNVVQSHVLLTSSTISRGHLQTLLMLPPFPGTPYVTADSNKYLSMRLSTSIVLGQPPAVHKCSWMTFSGVVTIANDALLKLRNCLYDFLQSKSCERDLVRIASGSMCAHSVERMSFLLAFLCLKLKPCVSRKAVSFLVQRLWVIK